MSRWICSIYFTETMATAGRWRGEGRVVLWISSDGDGKGKKIEKPKESLGLPTEPNQIAIPKTNPQKSYAKFLASH